MRSFAVPEFENRMCFLDFDIFNSIYIEAFWCFFPSEISISAFFQNSIGFEDSRGRNYSLRILLNNKRRKNKHNDRRNRTLAVIPAYYQLARFNFWFLVITNALIKYQVKWPQIKWSVSRMLNRYDCSGNVSYDHDQWRSGIFSRIYFRNPKLPHSITHF